MAAVPWWATNEPLQLGWGRRFGASGHQEICISTDSRTRHGYVIGSTGAGKSRFARRCIEQDIAANRGFCVIDAQDLVREVLWLLAERSLPGRVTASAVADLGDKVVLIEPAITGRYGAPGINFLQLQTGQIPYELVDALIEVLTELWPDAMGERLKDITRHSLLLLQEHGLTIAEMPLLLSDENVRRSLVARSQNADVRLFFEEHIAGLGPREVRMWFESSRNKWSAFASSPFIRPLLGQQRSTISLTEVINQGKILLINLSRHHLKRESRAALGGMLINALHQAALTREDVPPPQRYFFPIYIDEWQEYYCHSLLSILEAGRKYGIALNLFHQTTTQPPFSDDPGIIDTVLSNTHCRVCFSVSRKDAERLAGEFFPRSAMEVKHQGAVLGIPVERATYWSLNEERENQVLELMHQAPREAYISLKGHGTNAWPLQTVVPDVLDVVADLAKVEALRQHIARRYFRPAAKVEQEIRGRWEMLRQENVPRDFTR